MITWLACADPPLGEEAFTTRRKEDPSASCGPAHMLDACCPGATVTPQENLPTPSKETPWTVNDEVPTFLTVTERKEPALVSEYVAETIWSWSCWLREEKSP